MNRGGGEFPRKFSGLLDFCFSSWNIKSLFGSKFNAKVLANSKGPPYSYMS